MLHALEQSGIRIKLIPRFETGLAEVCGTRNDHRHCKIDT
jgi:hypothetical protein